MKPVGRGTLRPSRDGKPTSLPCTWFMCVIICQANAKTHVRSKRNKCIALASFKLNQPRCKTKQVDSRGPPQPYVFTFPYRELKTIFMECKEVWMRQATSKQLKPNDIQTLVEATSSSPSLIPYVFTSPYRPQCYLWNVKKYGVLVWTPAIIIVVITSS